MLYWIYCQKKKIMKSPSTVEMNSFILCFYLHYYNYKILCFLKWVSYCAHYYVSLANRINETYVAIFTYEKHTRTQYLVAIHPLKISWMRQKTNSLYPKIGIQTVNFNFDLLNEHVCASIWAVVTIWNDRAFD